MIVCLGLCALREISTYYIIFFFCDIFMQQFINYDEHL